MERGVIIGAGAHGREVAEILRQQAQKPGNSALDHYWRRRGSCFGPSGNSYRAVDVPARVIATKKKGWHEEATSTAGT